VAFIFDTYTFNPATGEAAFNYSLEGGLTFTEKIRFAVDVDYNQQVLERALFLAFILIGTSYYKTQPTPEVRFPNHTIDGWQAEFLNVVYQEGLSQFAFENNLTRTDLAHFTANGEAQSALTYEGDGILQLQSGGKDSLLTWTLLEQSNPSMTPLYVSSSDTYPAIIDTLSDSPVILRRTIDREALIAAKKQGGLNGHVPVTFIVLAISLVQAVLSGKDTVVASIGHEGEEPHAWIDDLPVNHQWSKTWGAEQRFAQYVERYVSPDITVGSPLRAYSELKIAELFVQKAWSRFGHAFSSCNVANYEQGAQNTVLRWCGSCPKCANSYLLFAAFVEQQELDALFGGVSLLAKPELQEIFKGLLGIDGVMKPFECIGEVDELRLAYQRAQERGYPALSFDVPASSFDIDTRYPMQPKLMVQ